MVKNVTPFGLRLQPDLKAHVLASAKANNRSINAEICFQLQRVYTPFWHPQRSMNDELRLLEEHRRMDSMARNS